MRSALGIVTGLLVVTLAAPAYAQQQQRQQVEGPDNYVTGYLNTNFGGDLFKEGDPSSTTGYGGSLTFWGRGLFSAEVDFNYNKSFFGDPKEGGDNSLITATLGGIVGPWVQGGVVRVRPYFAFGGGLMRSTIEEFATVGWADTKNMGLVEAGGGVLVLFNDVVGVRGDMRYRWGVGANSDEKGWGLIDKWTYMRGTIGVVLAF